jgi:hypothetical protein
MSDYEDYDSVGDDDDVEDSMDFMGGDDDNDNDNDDDGFDAEPVDGDDDDGTSVNVYCFLTFVSCDLVTLTRIVRE